MTIMSTTTATITGIENPTIQKVVAEYVTGTRVQRQRIASDLSDYCDMARISMTEGDPVDVEYCARLFAKKVFSNLNGEKMMTASYEECQGLAMMAIFSHKVAA